MKSEVLFEPVQLPVVKIAKEQVFGAKTSGEKQSFELFSRGGNGQRDNALLALPHWPKARRLWVRDCVAESECDHPLTKEPWDSDMGEEVIQSTLS